jgi:hypothetical protein
MAALTSWANEAPAVNHTASFEIGEAIAAHVGLDRSELHGSCLPKIIRKRFGQVIGGCKRCSNRSNASRLRIPRSLSKGKPALARS